MGHSIVYCDKCGKLLKEEDFLQGRASLSDHRSFCSDCRPLPAGTAPAAGSGAKPSSTRIPKPAPSGSVSSSRIPKQAPSESVSSTRIPRASGQDSRRLGAVPPPPPAEDSAAASGSRGLVVGLVVALAAGVALVAVFAGGTSEPRREGPGMASAPVVVEKPPPAPGGSSESRRPEEAARSACVQAYGIQTTHPKDLAAQWKAFEAARAASEGTSYAAEAEGQLRKIRRLFDDERRDLEARTQELVAKDDLKGALGLWEDELRRYEVPDWMREIQQRIADLKSEFDRCLATARDAAVEARRRGDDAEAQRLRARVAGWGIGGFAEQVDQALAAVVPAKPEPPPAPAGAASGLEAYRAAWKETLAPVAARDFARAARMLEKLSGETRDAAARQEAAEDLENLRLAASVVEEAAALLPKLQKGQKLPLAFWDADGTLTRSEEAIQRIDGFRLQIRSGDDSRVVPMGEIAWATLADLFRTRPTKKESDARAAVVACLLDGDVDGAQRRRTAALPSVGEKYVEAARRILERRFSDDREKSARKLFYEAEATYFRPVDGPVAAAKYRSLLAEYASTAFVGRNRGAIAARTEPLKDFLFTAEDLSAAPGFKLGKGAKGEAVWVSQQDLDLARMKDNFVEFEFAGGPDAEVHCWVLAGGCCQEVLTFYCQATELAGPDPSNPKERLALEPGAGSGLLLKAGHSSLKKLHSQHNGPKNPERFEWVQAPVLRFSAAGTKKVRLLSNQKGFAVAAAAVLTTHKGPPREPELREFERWRAETPGVGLRPGGVGTGSILREVWTGIPGSNVIDLTSQPAFKEDRPSEQGLISQFEGPTDIGDNYGTRIRGYVHPPASGAYVFWIASDDQGELYLSTDEDPAHKKKIASVPMYTAPREWGKFPEQQSPPIELKAGTRYYIEALHKEGGGGDHISVGWQLPSGVQERPIPGNRLSPAAVPKK